MSEKFKQSNVNDELQCAELMSTKEAMMFMDYNKHRYAWLDNAEDGEDAIRYIWQKWKE